MVANEERWKRFLGNLLDTAKRHDYVWEQSSEQMGRQRDYDSYYGLGREFCIVLTHTMPYQDETAEIGIVRKQGQFGFYLAGNYFSYLPNGDMAGVDQVIKELDDLGFRFDDENNFSVLKSAFIDQLASQVENPVKNQLEKELAE